MRRHGPLHLSRFVLAAFCSAGLACTSSQPASAPQPLVLLTGPPSGAYLPLGTALAQIYNTSIPDVHVTATPADGLEGAASNSQAVVAGKVDLAFSRSDLAYQVYRGVAADGVPSGEKLRSLAVVYTNAVHILVRRGSGITRGADFRGRRVQVGDETLGGTLARTVLEGYGVGLEDVQIVPNPRNAISRLKSGDLDLRIFASAYPLAGVDDVGVESLLRLMSMEPAVVDRLRSRFPFFKPVVIPKGTYKGQDEDVQTVGIDGLLLCRDTMPESLAYRLTKSLFDSLPALAEAQRTARLIDIGRAPSTPVPLHPGAARYYRERDLFR